MTTATTVAFSQLRLSPLNVRNVEPKRIEEMAANIAAVGIVQSLGVYEEGGNFWVFAGGRRLRGLEMLHAREAIPADYPVPVIIRDKAEAIDLSLAENDQRENMHPADSVRAFVLLRDKMGLSAEDIAVRYGYSNGHVAKLLRLGSLAPQILDALAADKIGMEAAKALTITDNHGAQIDAFELCGNNAAAIRRALTDEKVKTTSGPFLFVGQDAYEAAGGTITCNLFGDEAYADNPELVDELLWAKLDKMKAEFVAEGWHKVEVSKEQPHGFYSLGYLHPIRRAATEAEAEQLEDLRIKMEALEGEDDADEWAEVNEQFDRIEAGLTVYTDEQKASGGVTAFVSWDGTLKVRHYRAVAEEVAEGQKAVDTGPYAASMIERLTGIRTLALQQAIASQPALALDILLDTLTGQLIHGQYSHTMPVEIRPTQAAIQIEDEMIVGSQIENVPSQLVDRFGDIPAEGRFDTIRAMDDGDKMQLLAALVASTLNATVHSHNGISARHRTAESYAQAAGLDLRTVWTPTQPFFDRLKKSSLITILADECGEVAATNCSKKKKGDVAVTVNESLPAGWLPEPARSFAPEEFPEQAEDEGEMSEAA